jgi:hypothetical protein
MILMIPMIRANDACSGQAYPQIVPNAQMSMTIRPSRREFPCAVVILSCHAFASMTIG